MVGLPAMTAVTPQLAYALTRSSAQYVADAQLPTYSMRHFERESNWSCTKWARRWAVRSCADEEAKAGDDRMLVLGRRMVR
jgi:hypothetical protein